MCISDNLCFALSITNFFHQARNRVFTLMTYPATSKSSERPMVALASHDTSLSEMSALQGSATATRAHARLPAYQVNCLGTVLLKNIRPANHACLLTRSN